MTAMSATPHALLRRCGAFILCAVSTLISAAQEIPTGGASLLVETRPSQAGFYANTTANGVVATRESVTVTGRSFTEAARVATLNPTGEFYTSAMTFRSNRAVADGDVILMRVYVRSIETSDETGTVTMQAYVEGPGPDYTKSITYQINANSAWQEFLIPFRSNGSYAAGDLGFKFGFGATGRPQILEMGGVEAWWYGTSRTLAEMPRTSFSYVGREANASWRAEGAARESRPAHRRGAHRPVSEKSLRCAGG